ncbi:4857_t:CDS:2, partial [Racocetra persica]
ACDFGSFCFGIDGKYDLNSDGAPILSLIVEDNAESSAIFELDQTSLGNLEEQSNLLSPSIQKQKTVAIRNRK